MKTETDMVGKTYLYASDGLKFAVKVIDMKGQNQAFGRRDVLIRPVRGEGERWVWSSKLETQDTK